MWSNKCKVKDDNHFPQSTSNSPVHTTQDAVGFLCCQGTLLAHDHDDYPLSLTIQPAFFFSPASCPSVHPSIQTITALLGYKDIVRDSMKNVVKVKVTLVLSPNVQTQTFFSYRRQSSWSVPW